MKMNQNARGGIEIMDKKQYDQVIELFEIRMDLRELVNG